MRPFLAITSALADENRLRILLGLRGGELCVCQITELLGLAPSTVSKHISLLYQAGLVEDRKQGRWVHYRLAGAAAEPAARQALQWALESLKDSERIKDDARRLKQILKEDPETLCRRQLGKSRCCSSAPATPAAARWRKDSPDSSKAT
jgi:DNA-binding transcriptional ArsR family regulator